MFAQHETNANTDVSLASYELRTLQEDGDICA